MKSTCQSPARHTNNKQLLQLLNLKLGQAQLLRKEAPTACSQAAPIRKAPQSAPTNKEGSTKEACSQSAPIRKEAPQSAPNKEGSTKEGSTNKEGSSKEACSQYAPMSNFSISPLGNTSLHSRGCSSNN